MTEPRPERQRSIPLLPLWLAVPLAALAGVLMDLAYPEAALWPLAFVAVALLLLALIGRRMGGALLVGLVYGVVFFAFLVSWTSRYLGPIPWIALTTVEAVLTAVLLVTITLAYRWVPRVLPGRAGRLIVLPVTVAALWVGREVVLGSWPYGGFPWARLGMTQSESPLATLSSWVGVGGLGFLMVLLVAVLIEIGRIGAWRRPLVLALPRRSWPCCCSCRRSPPSPAVRCGSPPSRATGPPATSMSVNPTRSSRRSRMPPSPSSGRIWTSSCGRRAGSTTTRS
ncbi:hypothetical protein [Microbacterium sp. NIBRBAC000506063]|uniref:hypothetical protein n=1 Tax=Microbacterium sp. NIBRBAC000506063 TaxID=2734618 RepID=UPI002948BB2F|nr:hypothetical protein [Microbacterium sp. NIBRBAC000506063]